MEFCKENRFGTLTCPRLGSLRKKEPLALARRIFLIGRWGHSSDTLLILSKTPSSGTLSAGQH